MNIVSDSLGKIACGGLAWVVALSSWIPTAIAGDPASKQASIVSGTPTLFRDIQPLLLRSGCSNIRCHGSAEGQSGFKLSLRSFDPGADAQALAERATTAPGSDASPAGSLLIQKPTGQIDHGGGEVWRPGGDEATLVRRWIEGGMPMGSPDAPIELAAPRRIVCSVGQTVPVEVRAVYGPDSRLEGQRARSDYRVDHLCEIRLGDPTLAEIPSAGVLRALTPGFGGISFAYRGRLAFAQLVVRPPPQAVPPHRSDASKPASNDEPASTDEPASIDEPKSIDDFTRRTLADLGTTMAPRADRLTLLRRISLDLTGRPPSDGRVDAWLDQTAQRLSGTDDDVAFDAAIDELVDQLITSPEYASKWGRWFSRLMGLDESRLGSAAFAMKVDREKLAYQWYTWNRDRIAGDVPLCDLMIGHLAATSRNGMSLGRYQSLHESWCKAMQAGQWETSFASQPSNDLFWKAFDGDGNLPGEWIGRRVLAMDLQCARCHDHPELNVRQVSHRAFNDAVGSTVHHEQTLTASEKNGVLIASIATLAGLAVTIAAALAFWKRRLSGRAGKNSKAAGLLGPLIVGGFLGAGVFLAASYVHLVVGSRAPSRLGAGDCLVQMTSPWIPPGGILVTCAAFTFAATCWVRNRSIPKARAHGNRIGLIGLLAVTAVLILVTADLAWISPRIGAGKSSFVHALHRSTLRAVGIGGQGNQPREIYRSLEAKPVDPGSLALIGIAGDRSAQDPRESIARHLVDQDSHKRMARNLVNRVWKEIFGEGLAPNLDEISVRFPPRDPEALDQLTDRFVQQNWSLRWLLRQILASETYRRSGARGTGAGGSGARGTGARGTHTQSMDPHGLDQPESDDPWARHSPRMLLPEERFQLIQHVTGHTATVHGLLAPEEASAYESFTGVRIRSGTDRLLRDLHLAKVDRVQEVPLQGVQLAMTDPEIERWIRSPDSRAARFAAAYRLAGEESDDPRHDPRHDRHQLIIRLWQSTLGRHPTEQETADVVSLLNAHLAGNRKEDWEDACASLIWSLSVADEAFLNH